MRKPNGHGHGHAGTGPAGTSPAATGAAGNGPAGRRPASHGRDRATDELWPLMIEFALGLRGWWIDVCASVDLTPTQGLALKILDPDVPLAMNALAETLACDASNVTGVVDKLEARGLIARQAAESDRRVKVLVVTEKGRELRKKLLANTARPPAGVAALPKDVREKMTIGLRALLSARADSAALGAAK